jgi:hypothetical protein
LDQSQCGPLLRQDSRAGRRFDGYDSSGPGRGGPAGHDLDLFDLLNFLGFLNLPHDSRGSRLTGSGLAWSGLAPTNKHVARWRLLLDLFDLLDLSDSPRGGALDDDHLALGPPGYNAADNPTFDRTLLIVSLTRGPGVGWWRLRVSRYRLRQVFPG